MNTKKKKTLHKPVLPVSEKLYQEWFLSLDCLKIKGDDTKRSSNDQRSCKYCPVFKRGLCDQCGKAISIIANKLGILLINECNKKIISGNKDEKEKAENTLNWLEHGNNEIRLTPEDRQDLFGKILNEGIVNKQGKVLYDPSLGAQMSTWAMQIFRRMLNNFKLGHEILSDDIMSDQEDDNEKNWDDEISLLDTRNEEPAPITNPFNEGITGEIRAVLEACHERLRETNPKCAALLARFYSIALKGMVDDDRYNTSVFTHISSSELNQSSVFTILADEEKTTTQKVRDRIRHCKNNTSYLINLRGCLQEAGYGPDM
jgi:hypothetical protein